jgi:hypothetical protein
MAGRGEDRRSAARGRADFRVRITSPRATSGLAKDVSLAGMMIEVNRPPLIPVGKDVMLSFQLPGSKAKISTRGEVVRHVGHTGMGVKFIRLAVDETQAIAAYVEAAENA